MRQNNEINLLPAEISEKIAAGEVVDRPISIVKELVENSIDANAKNIIVEIKNGGKSFIRVSDDGEGIRSKQVEMAFLRHATSKIMDVNDLYSIDTLGFRGEALASIAAVSRLEAITRTSEEKSGIRLLIEGGKVFEKAPVGCPEGTTILVRDLFYNTPARMKFMKSDGAESSLIIDFISKMALAYPHIRFRMINNDSILFATRGNGDIYNNILTVYSKDIGDKLIRIDETNGDSLEILAYISPPHVTRPNRRDQVYFVNGRNIKDKMLEEAVLAAYKERIAQGRYPVIYLFLKVAGESIDVNIHPNKREIRFSDKEKVADFVSRSLLNGLKSLEGISDIGIKKVQINSTELFVPRDTNAPNGEHNRDEGKFELNDKPREKEKDTSEQVDIKTLLFTKRQEETQSKVAEKNLPYKTLPFDRLKPLGSAFATYILATDDEYLYLIDQHAAHERIFYEKLLKQFDEEVKSTQMLITPFSIEVKSATANLLELWLDKLLGMGYLIESFGPRTFLVKGIPSFMDLEDAKVFLENYIDEIGDGNKVRDEKALDRIITASCKKAIKGNNLLKIEEMEYLLNELGKADNPYSCPHGRPTLLKLSKQDVERMFKRS